MVMGGPYGPYGFHLGGGGFTGGGMEGRNSQVTVRLLVPLAAGIHVFFVLFFVFFAHLYFLILMARNLKAGCQLFQL